MHTLIDSMIAEFGFYKTRNAIQSLFDKDQINESKARAMMRVLRNRYPHDKFKMVLH